MYCLKHFKYNEIIRGRINKGKVSLKSMPQNALLEPEDVEIPQEVCDQLKIIELVKGDINALLLGED